MDQQAAVGCHGPIAAHPDEILHVFPQFHDAVVVDLAQTVLHIVNLTGGRAGIVLDGLGSVRPKTGKNSSETDRYFHATMPTQKQRHQATNVGPTLVHDTEEVAGHRWTVGRRRRLRQLQNHNVIVHPVDLGEVLVGYRSLDGQSLIRTSHPRWRRGLALGRVCLAHRMEWDMVNIFVRSPIVQRVLLFVTLLTVPLAAKQVGIVCVRCTLMLHQFRLCGELVVHHGRRTQATGYAPTTAGPAWLLSMMMMMMLLLDVLKPGLGGGRLRWTRTPRGHRTNAGHRRPWLLLLLLLLLGHRLGLPCTQSAMCVKNAGSIGPKAKTQVWTCHSDHTSYRESTQLQRLQYGLVKYERRSQEKTDQRAGVAS